MMFCKPSAGEAKFVGSIDDVLGVPNGNRLCIIRPALKRQEIEQSYFLWSSEEMQPRGCPFFAQSKRSLL